MSNFNQLQELLHKKADLQARLNLLTYHGTVEIKTTANGQYLYIRRRELGKIKSEYVGKYTQELYELLLKQTKEAKDLQKEIRKLDRQLLALGYNDTELSTQVQNNLDFARINMKASIYDQAVLEGIATSYPQTETILENGKVNDVSATDVQKILNLKHAWEFILDKNVISSPSDYHVLCHIARLTNEGFFDNGGRIRGVPVRIGGSSYVPPLPIEADVKDNIRAITSADKPAIDVAIDLCLYCMKTQIFLDGNKRAAVIFANHYLIGKGQGLLVIPYNTVPQFKQLLVDYYEGKDLENIKAFLKDVCWQKI